MAIYKTLDEIQQSLMSKIEQYSGKENLTIKIQVEDYDGIYDTALLLSDSDGELLLDVTYTESIMTCPESFKFAEILHSNVKDLIRNENVILEEVVEVKGL